MSRPVFRRSWMNRRRYRFLMSQRACVRSIHSAPRRRSRRPTSQATNRARPCHSPGRDGRVAIGLTLAILSFPLLASCERTPTRPAPIEPLPTNAVPHKAIPSKPASPSKPGRTISFQGLDNDFRGATTVLPDNQVIHHKEPP